MDRKVVIIPTYNEKENIEKIIRKVFSLEGSYHILIIEDGSPDGTGAIVKGLQAEFPCWTSLPSDALSLLIKTRLPIMKLQSFIFATRKNSNSKIYRLLISNFFTSL